MEDTTVCIEIGLGNMTGDLFAIKQSNRYLLVLGDIGEEKYVPISKQLFEKIKEEFEE